MSRTPVDLSEPVWKHRVTDELKLKGYREPKSDAQIRFDFFVVVGLEKG